MSKAPPPIRKPFPWLLLVLLLASIYGFWVLPFQLGRRPIEVEFEPVGVTPTKP